MQFSQLGAPCNLAAVVAKWQRLAWYNIEGSQHAFVHNIGVKPGDPAADVLFALDSFPFHEKIWQACAMQDWRSVF